MARLGAFELIEPLGQGGMGHVWRGRHRMQGMPAAVKTLKGPFSEKRRYAFERKVQAHAGLSHPGVVHVFDYGLVDRAFAAASYESIEAGTPYLAMELADAGTLRDQLPLADWPTVHALTAGLLDALAYAHARDVIHRDIKPENILVFTGDDGRLRPRLADFGIAHALGSEENVPLDRLSRFSETPRYMPPEQARGHWREYGPWTDLYALGCIIWEAVCGRPPFPGRNPIEIISKHLDDDPPPLQLRMEAPRELEPWLRRMLAKRPRERFRRAADAHAAFPPASTATGPNTHAARPTYIETAETLGTDATLDESVLSHAAKDAGDAALSTDETSMRAPFPDTWRRGEHAPLPDPLVGAGLGLFGLREVPFVDRDAARETLWGALSDVVDTDELRVVFLAGGSGAGKSKLAEWRRPRPAGRYLRVVDRARGSAGSLVPGGLPRGRKDRNGARRSAGASRFGGRMAPGESTRIGRPTRVPGRAANHARPRPRDRARLRLCTRLARRQPRRAIAALRSMARAAPGVRPDAGSTCLGTRELVGAATRPPLGSRRRR